MTTAPNEPAAPFSVPSVPSVAKGLKGDRMAKKKRKKKATPKHPPEVLDFVRHVFSQWNKGPVAKEGLAEVPYNLIGLRDLVAERRGEPAWESPQKLFASISPLKPFYSPRGRGPTMSLGFLARNALRGEEALYEGKYRQDEGERGLTVEELEAL